MKLTRPNQVTEVRDRADSFPRPNCAAESSGAIHSVTDTEDQRHDKTLAGILFGRPLASDDDAHQRVGAGTGIPIFGLDALGSAAYGPEAALTILIPMGAIGLWFALPITITIIVLLAIVYMSYRQTIAAYPTGGGSYTVAQSKFSGPRNETFSRRDV